MIMKLDKHAWVVGGIVGVDATREEKGEVDRVHQWMWPLPMVAQTEALKKVEHVYGLPLQIAPICPSMGGARKTFGASLK